MSRYTYVIAKKVLDVETCKNIIALGEGKWEDGVEMGDNAEKIKNNRRKCSVAWIDKPDWLLDSVLGICNQSNQIGGWQYQISNIEDIQLTKYKKGGYYKLHRDGYSDHFATPEGDNTVRKLSMTCLLSNSFKGGELKFAQYHNKKCEMVTDKTFSEGDAIVFPSEIEHEVTTVEGGVRYALVVWFRGFPFR